MAVKEEGGDGHVGDVRGAYKAYGREVDAAGEGGDGHVGDVRAAYKVNARKLGAAGRDCGDTGIGDVSETFAEDNVREVMARREARNEGRLWIGP